MSQDDRTNAGDAKLERAKDRALGTHDSNPSAGDLAGEAIGGTSGVLAGAAIGSVGGPIGTIIGGLAGALGGWWSGRAISEAASAMTEDDEAHYRTHWESSTHRQADRAWDDVRPAYHLGHLAARNPDYRGRQFNEVESDLQRGWSLEQRNRHGDWAVVRPYVSEGYSRSSRTLDRVTTVGASSTDRTTDSARDAAHASGNAMERGWEKAKEGARHLADKADDLKDRVDGDPSTRPGPDLRDRNPSQGFDVPRGTDEHNR